MSPIYKKLEALTNKQLIQLSNELRQTSVPENAFVREVIKDTELDTCDSILAFVGVGQILGLILADRLEIADNNIEEFYS